MSNYGVSNINENIELTNAVKNNDVYWNCKSSCKQKILLYHERSDIFFLTIDNKSTGDLSEKFKNSYKAKKHRYEIKVIK